MAEDKKKEIDVAVIEVTEEYLKEKLYKIRGKRVLLDADLAEIYGYDTKGFNRQVKNNIEKFDEDFMFELTDEELEDFLQLFESVWIYKTFFDRNCCWKCSQYNT